jgi:hypothetical protein
MKREYYRLLAIIVASLGIHIRDDYHRIYSRPVLGREVICYTVDIIQTCRGRFQTGRCITEVGRGI